MHNAQGGYTAWSSAEAGTSTPMLLARSRHASMCFLKRYACPGPEAIAHHAAATETRAASPALTKPPGWHVLFGVMAGPVVAGAAE